MKKAFRTPVVALSAAIAMVAVGVAPAFARAPSEATVLANVTVVHNVPSSALNMGGSSFDANLVNAAYAQWKTYSGNNASALNAYASSSSGTGRSNVIAGTDAIGFTDVPLNYAGQDTSDTSQYIQTPVALGGVGIIVNLNYKHSVVVKNAFGQANTPALTSNGTSSGLSCQQLVAQYPVALDGATLGSIFAGSTTSWSSPSVIADNPRLTVYVNTPYIKAVKAKGKKGHKGYVPAKKEKNHLVATNCLTFVTTPTITVFSRTAGSGTTFIFRDYLSKVDPTEYPYPSSAAFSAAPVLFSSSGTLAPAVATKDGGIGYVEYGYALQNHLPTLRLKNATGSYVALNSASVTSAATAGLAAINADRTGCPNGFSVAGPTTYNASSVSTKCFSITDVNYGAAYPIAGFSYAVAKVSISDQNTAVTASKFLLYLTQSNASSSTPYGQNLAASQAYVALPKPIESIAYSIISRINSGADIALIAAGN
jgi:ABC-type phosphate transport system substrate-binding protein